MHEPLLRRLGLKPFHGLYVHVRHLSQYCSTVFT
jgi:hypothetical protein